MKSREPLGRRPRRFQAAALLAALLGLLLLEGCSRLMSIIDPSAF